MNASSTNQASKWGGEQTPSLKSQIAHTLTLQLYNSADIAKAVLQNIPIKKHRCVPIKLYYKDRQ